MISLFYLTSFNSNLFTIFWQNFWQFSPKILYSFGIVLTIATISDIVTSFVGLYASVTLNSCECWLNWQNERISLTAWSKEPTLIKVTGYVCAI